MMKKRKLMKRVNIQTILNNRNKLFNEVMSQEDISGQIASEKIVFTIYCGYQESEKIYDQIISLLNQNFEGYTVLNTTGYWFGEKEKALKIDIIGTVMDIEKVKDLCKEINTIANQEATLLVYDSVKDTEVIYDRALVLNLEMVTMNKIRKIHSLNNIIGLTIVSSENLKGGKVFFKKITN